jgi:hypothetical protein
MPASETAKNWNNQWGKEVVHQKKSVLPPTRNVRKKVKRAKSNKPPRSVP